MSSAKFSIFWDVENSDKYTGAPERQKTRNYIDAHGDWLDLPRLEDEGGVDYVKRLRSVVPLRAGSNQAGLVHGVTRELGLEEKTGIRITPISDGLGGWLAPAPHIEVNATTLTLYSEWYDEDTYTIDTSIDIFGHGEGYLVDDVVTLVLQSSYFVAELGPYMTGQEKANGLLPGKSSVVIEKEVVPPTTYFFLENTNIVEGSLSFSEKTIFLTEQESVELVLTDGDYFVDYPRGIVTVYGSANGSGRCRYIYRALPYRVRWSPVVVYSLRDDTYRTKLFETEVMPDNSERNGLVSAEGSEVYTQLFAKSPCLWGE